MGIETIALAALGTAIVGTGMQVKGSLDMASAQRKSMKTQQRMASIQAQRERTQQIRASRAARAQILQAGANTGAGESSSVMSGAAGATARGFQNIGYINMQESAGVRIGKAQNDMIAARGVSALGAGISDLGSAVMSGRQEIANIFGTGE